MNYGSSHSIRLLGPIMIATLSLLGSILLVFSQVPTPVSPEGENPDISFPDLVLVPGNDLPIVIDELSAAILEGVANEGFVKEVISGNLAADNHISASGLASGNIPIFSSMPSPNQGLSSIARSPLPMGYSIADRYAYRQDNWIQRGVTNGSGGVTWTDRLNLRWTTNPGAITSRVDYSLTYFPRNGYFSNIRIQTRATRNGAAVASTGWRPQAVGSTTRFIDNSVSTRGAELRHITELAATSSVNITWSDQQFTTAARCELSSNRCRYP